MTLPAIFRALLGLEPPVPPEEEAFVQWGYGHERKEVFRDADGRPYVRLYGETVLLNDTPREVIWIKRKQGHTSTSLPEGQS